MTALWLKDPLAILADSAERGVIVEDGRIAALVPAGQTPDVPAFDASAHVVLPGLINTHHHFYQTLTRATPAALDRTLFGWLRTLYPIWARLTPETVDSAATVAMAELLLSGCTTTTDHHYVFPARARRRGGYRGGGGAPARHPCRAHARFDEPLRTRRRPAAGFRGAGRGHDPAPTARA